MNYFAIACFVYKYLGGRAMVKSFITTDKSDLDDKALKAFDKAADVGGDKNKTIGFLAKIAYKYFGGRKLIRSITSNINGVDSDFILTQTDALIARKK